MKGHGYDIASEEMIDGIYQNRIKERIEQEEELDMLLAYATHFGPHPIYLYTFDEYVFQNWKSLNWKYRMKKPRGVQELDSEKAWNSLSDRDKTNFLRLHIENMIEESQDHDDPLTYPELTEWYDQYIDMYYPNSHEYM